MHKSWKLIWCDDFKNGEINPKYWNLQVEKAGRFNQEWQRYTNSSKNAFVENNYLVLKAIHEGEVFSCSYCDRKYTANSSLQTHIKSIHEGEVLSCSYCEYKFTQKTHLYKAYEISSSR